MLVTSKHRMARDDYTTTIMGESGFSQEWRERKPRPKKEFIHSGHFMVSDPFKGEEKSKNKDRQPPGYDFEKYATAGTSENYKFNQTDLEIDSSFAKLFECLNLAYTGCKIVSPKWKTFKGQKVSLQDKIRLNNAIWREWHNQFILGKKPFLCHFSLPLLENEYKAPTAVVLEGKYGKRTTTAVVGEYQKWRAFFLKQKKRHSKHGEAMEWSQIASLTDKDFFTATGQVPMVLDEDALLSEFSDTLFSSLNQSFIFPNPREFSHAGVSVDAIQPGLVGLQPPLEELMDTLDGLPEIRTTQQSSQIQSVPFVFTAGDQQPYQNVPTSQSLAQQQQQQEPQGVSAVNSNLNQVLLASALLSQTDSLESQDLSSLLVNTQQPQQQQQQQHSLLQSNVGTLPQAAPQQHAILTQQQQQQQPATTSFTLTPQLLGQLLQAQLQQQQQQQQQQQVSQKNATVLNLNSALLSSLGVNQNSNFSGSLLQSQQQQQQSNLTQATGLSMQQASQGINQQQFTAVPVKITRAVDIDGLGNQNQQGLAAGSSTIQIQNSQSRILITPQIQQQQQSVHSSASLLDSDQLQLLQQQQQQQQQQQTLLQQQQQNMVTPKLEQSSYMQDFNMSSPQASNQDLLLSGMTGVTTTATHVEEKRDSQTQALKLLQKVASHVSQTNTNNLKLFTPEQNSIFNRIFADNTEQQGQDILKQQQSMPQKPQQNKVPSRTAAKQSQSATRTVIFQTPPSTGCSHMGASRTVQKDCGGKGKAKQTLGKKPIMKASSSSSGSGANSPMARTPNRTLLTHLLTGGKYDPTSGIVLTTSPPAKSPSTASSSPVSNVVLTTIKADLGQPVGSTTLGSQTAVTAASHILNSNTGSVFNNPSSAARVVSVTSSPVVVPKASEPTLFTIGASNFPSPESKTEGNDSSDDKKTITAEQKRRTNIRCGFETLHQLIPSVSQNPNTKVSKAAMLQKGVDYIRKLQSEKNQLSEEMRLLKEEISTLNVAISESQSQLPASGVPVTRQRYDQMRDNFDEYVRERTEQNWKFWIFSIIIRPLFESFNGTVSTASREELCRTVLSWLDRHCSLLALRPTVLSSLTLLSRITSILSDPTQVPQQAVQAVNKRDRSNSSD